MQPPTDISAVRDEHQLVITWPDGAKAQYGFKYLREACVCARCVHEITGEPLLDPDTVPEDLQLENMQLVGNYAVKFSWSDGHDTGIYTWERLRELSPQ